MATNYFHRFNTDNVHARAVIVGLVNLLNSKVQYENVYSDTESSVVTVPFYYNFGGDERFLQDYFTHWNECMTPQMVDGNIDPIPRGIVTLGASTINTNMLTNRFVRGNFVKQVGNEVLTYSAFLNSIPLTMSFDVKIVADTSLDAFKIQQAVLETFYKTQVFSVEFRGFRVPCQVGFPEDQGIEKTFEFTYQSETEISFSCPLQLETYYPVTDPTTQRFGGNRMNYPGGPNLNLVFDEKYNLPRLNINSPVHDETYFSSGQMQITWSNTGPITRVNIYYRKQGTANWIPIVLNYQNSGIYTWDIPFFNTSGEEVSPESAKAFVDSVTGSGARLRAIIDSAGSVDKIIVFNGGSAYEGVDSIIVDDQTLVVLQPQISPNVIAGTVVGSDIFAVGADFVPTPTNQFELKIENANDDSIYKALSRTIQFQGTLNAGSDFIAGIIPNISVLANLEALGIEVGQTVESGGIIIGSTIATIDAANNQIQIDNNANLNIPLELITGATVSGYVTIE